MIAILTSLLLLACAFLIYQRHKRSSLSISKIPAPKGWPLLGNLPLITLSVSDLMDTIHNKFAKQFHRQGIFKLQFGPLNYVFLTSPDTIGKLLLSCANIAKASGYKFHKEMLGDGLLLASGLKWHRDRRFLQSAFHVKHNECYNAIFNDVSKTLLGVLKLQSEPADLRGVLVACIQDAAFRMTLGRDLGVQKKQHPLTTNLLKVGKNTDTRVTNPFLYSDYLYKLFTGKDTYSESCAAIRQLINELISERKIQLVKAMDRETCDTSTKPMIDMLLEFHLKDPSHFTVDDIRDQLITFIVAAYHTTGALVTFLLTYLAKHSKIQRMVQQELDLIFPSKQELQVSSEQLKQMPFTEAVIKETLRLVAPGHIIGRKLSEDLDLGDYIVPKGKDVFIAIHALHRRAELYVDAEEFRPERWLPGFEHLRSKHPFAFLPFSGGLRACIGQRVAINEIKIILCHVMQSFDVLPKEDGEIKIGFDAATKLAVPFPIAFQPRINKQES